MKPPTGAKRGKAKAPSAASLKQLTAANLERLGAARLAEILLDLTAGDAVAGRRLRLELAAAADPKSVAREVRKRLSTIARSRSFIEWNKTRNLAQDLEAQRSAIAEKVARIDPAEALDLMWRLLDLAEGVYERADDSNGLLGDVFAAACADLAPLAEAAKPEPGNLARQVFEALKGNEYGQYDGVIEALAPALGGEGLERLKALLQEWSAVPMTPPPEGQRQQVGWGSSGAIYADELAVRHRNFVVSSGLKTIADLTGDVDGFVAQYTPEQRSLPRVAAGIAARLLDAGRGGEALSALDAASHHPSHAMLEWVLVRLEVLEAMGRREDAQELRWQRFTETLDPHFLREYLGLLPDFEDDEAERRALDHAAAFPDAALALAFFTDWSHSAMAAELVRARGQEFDGRDYEVLVPAAEMLRQGNPWAATVLWRMMIADSLDNSRTTRYRYAAEHLKQCEEAAGRIDDMQGLPDHAAFVRQLRGAHGKKRSFWSKTGLPV